MNSICLKSLLLLGLLSFGCGDTDPQPPATGDGGANDEDAMVSPEDSMLPWATGNTWTYLVTSSIGSAEKVTTVGERELVGGSGPNKDKMAYRVETLKNDGTDRTLSWQAPLGEKVVRYREQAYHAQDPSDLELEEHWDPYKIHIDGSLEEDTWLEVYQETKLPVGGETSTTQIMDRWFIDSESEEVTVPAGTFDAVVFRKIGGSEKRYWYVRGVGKVKEIGSQTEELVSYEVAP